MPTEEECLKAVQALYRVRAVEKPPGPDGRKEVWHQGNKGAELLSTVDAEGRLEEQDLTLFKEVFYWSRGSAGMKTGKLVGSADVSSRGSIMWDPAPAPVRLERCRKALDGYSGKDEYLRHLRDAVNAALAGLDWDDQRVVTRPVQPGDSQTLQLPPQTGPFKKLITKITGAVKKK